MSDREALSDVSPADPRRDAPTVDTVEALVRRQMAAAMGGRRGLIEAAIPGALFTIGWLVTKDVRIALVASLAAAGVALLVRVLQRSTLQYAVNALVGIGVGYLFIRWAAGSGGSEADQALAYFLPGLLYTGVYTILMAATCLVGWPAFGFLVGSVTGDPTAWHDDRQIVRLCSRLTWLFLAPGAINVTLQGTVYLLGRSGALDVDLAVATLGVLRVGVGWAIRALAWSAMIWLLARNATPLEKPAQA